MTISKQLSLLDEARDLFTLTRNTCDRCGAAFETGRPSRLCALCAGPRACVACPVCELEHDVPVLASHKLCKACAADMTMTLAMTQARLDDAHAAWLAADERLQADYAHADDATQARYDAAVTLRNHGELNGKHYTLEQARAAWEKALGRGDELAALLSLYDTAAIAAQGQQRLLDAVRAVEEAIDG